MYDYHFVIVKKDGLEVTRTYQKLIRELKIENEVIEGAKMSEGGAPQAAWLQQLLLKYMTKTVTEIKVLFNGNQIF